MTTKRPASAKCGPTCDRRRHATIRAFLNALDELRDAAEEMLELPDPSSAGKEDSDMELVEWASMTADVGALLWSLNTVGTLVGDCVQHCCYSDAEAEEYQRAVDARRRPDSKSARKRTAEPASR